MSGSLTLAVWLAVSGIGWLGGMMRYPQATIPPRPPPPVAVQDLKVELAGDMSPPAGPVSPEADASDAAAPPPPEAPPVAPPPAMAAEDLAPPPLMDLAVPSPEIAFAVPVQEPQREPDPAPPNTPPAAVAPGSQVSRPGGGTAGAPPRLLTMGQGEGRQPRPLYPREAERAGQEGRVTVRMTVGENGRVVSAEAFEPCPYPILNEAAVKTVRDRWRFSPGAVRVYQVAIVFRLD